MEDQDKSLNMAFMGKETNPKMLSTPLTLDYLLKLEEGEAGGKFLDWNLKTDSEGQYLYITRDGQPGEIQVKAEMEGFVVDIYKKDGVESLASTSIDYRELKEEEPF